MLDSKPCFVARLSPCALVPHDSCSVCSTMIDIHVQKLARVLIHHALRIKPGNTLRIKGRVAALPLLQAVYYEALKAGAFIIARLDHASFQELLLRDGTTEQLEFVNPLLTQEIETFETWLDVLAETNTRQFSSIDPGRMSLHYKALGPAQELFQNRASTGAIRAVHSLYPTEAYAQEAHSSLDVTQPSSRI